MNRLLRKEIIKEYVDNNESFSRLAIMQFVRNEFPNGFTSERSVCQILRTMPVEKQAVSGTYFYFHVENKA